MPAASKAIVVQIVFLLACSLHHARSRVLAAPEVSWDPLKPVGSLENGTAMLETSRGVMDHRVTAEQAAAFARQLDPAKKSGTKTEGCAQCSLQERLYCESAALMNDHCCCDTKLREPLLWMPHECWRPLPPAEPCEPVAENCAEYARITQCCCRLHAPAQNGASWVPMLVGEVYRLWLEQRRQQGLPTPQLHPQTYSQNDEHNSAGRGAHGSLGGLLCCLILVTSLVTCS